MRRKERPNRDSGDGFSSSPRAFVARPIEAVVKR